MSYPTSTARRLRITVAPADGQPLPVTGARLVVATTAERREEAVAATLVSRDEDTTRRTTRLVLDLGGRRPVDRVELDVSERNFHRVVLIEAGDDRTQWRWLGSCSISGVDTGRIQELKEQVGSGDRPEGLPATEFILLYDADAQKSVAIVFFDNEDDYRQGDATLSAMPTDDTPGHRSSVARYDVAIRVSM